VVREQVESLVAAGRRFLLCDLRESAYADSDALRFLAEVQERLRARGGKLTLIVADPGVIARALRLLRWEQILPWSPSARQAWRVRARRATV
jgi:anti-anti-sigma regulatory factor